MDYYENPFKWADKLTGTWPRLLATIFVHILAFIVAWKSSDPERLIYYLLVFGVIIPFLYLLAIKNILQQSRTLQKTPNDRKEN